MQSEDPYTLVLKYFAMTAIYIFASVVTMILIQKTGHVTTKEGIAVLLVGGAFIIGHS